MATYTRNNAWNNGGTFDNPDLIWYAKGVATMMSRGIADPTSWWFYAAIHGEYVSAANSQPTFPGWQFVKPVPNVSTSPLPSQSDQDVYWNQCQHGSWYFCPWHRGYLMALEAQLRLDIVAAGGPSTWALPYWNYFGGTNGSQYVMPPAFAAQTLPDGSANSLFVDMRYGPDGNGNVYLPTAAGEAAHPTDPNFSYGPVTTTAMNGTIYTGHNSQTKPPGFGGPQTTFSHSGRTHGNFESDPHDLVHVYVGGSLTDTDYGLMADPGTAALDPIFYLHHSNIDRMWALWNSVGNANPTDPSWLNGPTRGFVMPGAGAGAPAWNYTPAQVQNLGALNYTYQELQPLAAPAPGHPMLAQRFALLGAPAAAAAVAGGAAIPAASDHTELLGASQTALRVAGNSSKSTLKLDSGVRRKASASLAAASMKALPNNFYLKVENVTGTFDASVLGVYINLPDEVAPGNGGKYLAGHVALFGLRQSSMKDAQHGGEGLSFVLDITSLMDGLHVANALDVDSLQISLVPNRKLPDGAEITVGRISIFRQGA